MQRECFFEETAGKTEIEDEARRRRNRERKARKREASQRM
jgi:hypothetical protein